MQIKADLRFPCIAKHTVAKQSKTLPMNIGGSRDLGTGNVMLKPRESDKPEEKVTLAVSEPVTATFALRYLVNFAKAAPLCGTVELGLGADAPLLVKYNLETGDNGYMQFYLAPKIDD